MNEVRELKGDWRPPAQTLEMEPALDTAKRQQLMEGARRAFLEHGFDGASVGDIVRAAGISKGTLYAYFPSKEKLFETLVIEDRRKQAEAVCIVDEDDEDVARVLTKLGRSLLNMLVQPANIAFVRVVIGASAKFPQIGRVFYEAGPAQGIARLSSYLSKMTDKGVLETPEPERAAKQFFDLCKSGIHVRMLLGYASEPPASEEIDQNVESAVNVFLKAYTAGVGANRRRVTT